ncbi:MAG: LolA family protein [Planctomycetota bacterium]
MTESRRRSVWIAWMSVALFGLTAALRPIRSADATAGPPAGLSEHDRQAAEDLINATVQVYSNYKGYHAKVVGISPIMGNAPGTGDFWAIQKIGWRRAKLELKSGQDILSREIIRSGLFVYAINVNPGGTREVHRFYQDGFSSTFFVPDPIERLQELNRRYLFTEFADHDVTIDGQKIVCKRIAGTLRDNAYDAEIKQDPDQKAYFQQLAAMSQGMTIDIEVGKGVRQVRVLSAQGKEALGYTFGDIKTDETLPKTLFEYKPAPGEKVIEHEAPQPPPDNDIKERVTTAVDLKAAGHDDPKCRELIEKAQKSVADAGGFTAQIRLVLPASLEPQGGSVSGIPAKCLEKIEIAMVMMEGQKGGNVIVNDGREIMMKMDLPGAAGFTTKTVYMKPVGPVLQNMQSPPMMLPMADLVELKRCEEGSMLDAAENKQVKVWMVEGRFDAEIAIKRLGLDKMHTDAAKAIIDQLRDAAKETPGVRFYLRESDFFPLRYERCAPDGKPIYISDLYLVKTHVNLNPAEFR